jgi:hypothetical protein
MRNYAGILLVALALLACSVAAESVTMPIFITDHNTVTGVTTRTVTVDTLGSRVFVAPTSARPKGETVTRIVVVNQDGKPIPKATVYAITTDGSKQTYNKLSVDKNGKLRYVSRGWTPLVAIAPGYSYGMPIDQPDRTNIQIKLWPEYKLKGRIVDESGKPVVGAKVIIRNLYGRSRNGGDHLQFPRYRKWSETTTAKDGSYLLPHLPAPQKFDYWEADLGIASKGRASITKRFSSRDLAASAKITQPLECVIEGVLYLPGKSGPAPVGSGIVVSVPSQFGWEPRQTRTDKDGKFRVGELPPGRAGIMLSPPEFRWNNGKPDEEIRPWVTRALDVTLDSRNPTRAEMVLTPGALIKGVVKKKADGQPAKQARLIIRHAGIPDNSYTPEILLTDDSGEFRARVVPGGVQVSVQSYENFYYQPDDAPGASFKIAEGEDKTGIEILVTPSTYEAARKPVPVDFGVKPGDYELKWNPEFACRSFTGYGFGDRKTNEVLALLKGRPKKASKNVLYRAYQFDGRGSDGLLMLAIDKSSPTGPYDTVVVDRNRNFDLSDDAPGNVAPNEAMRSAKWVEVQSHQGIPGGEQTNHPIQVNLQVYDAGARGAYCYIQKKGGWTGLVDTNAGQVDCAVGDTNCNGAFDDVTSRANNDSAQIPGDTFFLDDNGLGRLSTQDSGPHTVQIYSVSQIGRKFYSIRINPVGNRLNIRPYAGPTGSIIVTSDDVQGMSGQPTSFTLVGRDATYNFSECQGKPVTLPVGTYQITQCTLALNTKKLDKPFNLVCDISSTPLEVRADEQSAFGISGPISLAINPEVRQIAWKPGTTVTMNWNIKIGKDATVTAIGDNRTPPRVKFIDSKGKTVRTVNAGYT